MLPALRQLAVPYLAKTFAAIVRRWCSYSKKSHVQKLINEFGRLDVLDDLIQNRAADETQCPILAYPRLENDVSAYEYFTGQDLDRFINHGVKKLLDNGFTADGSSTVALFAPSDLDFIITLFSLSRLGHTVLLLSTRLAPAAVVSLLDATGCQTILHGSTEHLQSTVSEVAQRRTIRSTSLLCRADYDKVEDVGARFHREIDRDSENKKTCLILHSSGSTGLPKPLFLSHQAIMTHPLQGLNMHSFNGLPWYHLHGLSTSFQAMWMRKTAYLYNAKLPLTATHLTTVLETVRPEALHAVPYVLKLLGESARGIEAMKQCRVVTYGGAHCPDELGDRLVDAGVKLGATYGLTEAGFVGDSISRPEGDNAWNYIEIHPNVRDFVQMQALGNDLYECVYLSGHPALSVTNSDDPPNSFHSKDVFTPHPTIPNRWKYITRMDDRITLVNGEKVLPLPIEGRIRQDALVREAVVVGVNQAIPGLLAFRSSASQQLSDEEFIDNIWPTVQDANSRAEQFSQITRDMIIPLGHELRIPRTDKGSIIRAQVYSQYASTIDQMYQKLEDDPNGDGSSVLEIPALEEYLMKLFATEIGRPLPSTETEFFAAGVDSLKAIHARRLIQKDISIGTQNLSSNVIFETGNVRGLAEHLYSLRTNGSAYQEDEKVVVSRLLAKYSQFKQFHNDPKYLREGSAVVLTGATGSTGAHVLAKLVCDDQVSQIYCLVRREDPLQAIRSSLQQRGLEISEKCERKIVALKSDLSRDDFGLDGNILSKIKETVGIILHIAWPVNFNIPLRSFESDIKGLHNLIQLSLSVHAPNPAHVFFCSSISVAMDKSSPGPVEELPIDDMNDAYKMGYAHSKFVGEHIISHAHHSGARAYSMRIGQICGDSHKGNWNDTEAVPLMIRSALTLKALPQLNETCSWLPVDQVADTMLDLARFRAQEYPPSPPLTGEPSPSESDDSVYNVCNPRTFSWAELLEELRHAGLNFETVPFDTWIDLLKASERRGEETINPAVKLVDHFVTQYGGNKRSVPEFSTSKTQRDSATLRQSARILEGGYVRLFLNSWMTKWQPVSA